MNSIAKKIKLGDYIQQVDVRNTDLSVNLLLGVSNDKKFIPSIANIIGTDLKNYKVVEKGQFAFGPVTSRNGDRISIALLEEDKCIVSSSYLVFEITDLSVINPEYLILWFKRPEFDRYARFMSHGSVRELFTWEKMCETLIPCPSISEQIKIVKEHNAILEKIKSLNEINQKLDEEVFAVFKSFNFINSKNVSLGNACKVVLGGTPSRDNSNYWNGNIPWINSGEINKFRIIDGTEYITQEGLRHSSTKMMPKNTVVIAITGATLGQYSLLLNEVCANQSVIGIIPNETLPFQYLYPYIRFALFDLLKKQTGGAQPHINKDNVQAMNIEIPENMQEYLVLVTPLFNMIEHNCYQINILNKMEKLLYSKY